ncbi:ATP-binding protein [Brucella sp. 21LCYQ03]|nr:ATP-binding protein [Brucella sp. 21LCYQ03]
MELVRPKVPPREQFADISAVKRARDGIVYAMNFGESVQIVSPAGYGKTTALHYLAEEFGGIYCQVGQAHKSVPDMYRLLLSAFNIYYDSNNYTRALYDTLVERLSRDISYHEVRNKRLLLIVDEVQTLEATAQRELLNIQETCNLALVISGNGERLTSKVDRGAWDQIDSRMGMRIKLPGLSKQDCIDIGSAFGVEGMDTYEAISNYGRRTNARYLGRLLREAKALAAGTAAIQLHHIQGVMKAKGRLDDLRLLKPEPA